MSINLTPKTTLMLPIEPNVKTMNRTAGLTEEERGRYKLQLFTALQPLAIEDIVGTIFCQDIVDVLPHLPERSVDLLFLDPPYNLTKDFNGSKFAGRTNNEYAQWMESWFAPMMSLLKPTASVYVCGDWRSSAPIQTVVEKYLTLRNRITFEREKGRGAMYNWKNCHEDIWFATVSDHYTFNAEAVKLRRRVIAPYRENGKPKDWNETESGNFRDTSPSNIWTDITIPFWSMPENTPHPTQKPEKLLAKVILASSHKGDVVFDPFLGSGTTAVVAQKLGRRYIGIERDEEYCCYAMKRLERAESNSIIQGYEGGVFWERNSLAMQKKDKQSAEKFNNQQQTADTLF